ncbi:MAG: PAS domain S-box protein [Cryomorphaceae bacterium]
MKTQQYNSLIDLSRSENLYNGNFSLFAEDAIRFLANELEVSRVSFWLYNGDEDSIECHALYKRETDEISSGQKLYKRDYPKYFNAFKQTLVINAPDAYTDERTIEFAQEYLPQTGVSSLLDAQVHVAQEFLGVMCLEHCGSIRKWSTSDELYLRAIASYVGQSYLFMLNADEHNLRMQSERNYINLFEDNPIPMWVYDHESLKFLKVNKAATVQYGYSKEEFLEMSILDIRPPEERVKLEKYLKTESGRTWSTSSWIHKNKKGELMNVEVSSDWTVIDNERQRLVMAQNKTQEYILRSEKEGYLKKIKEGTFFASHNLRAPVTRLMGLNQLLSFEDVSKEELEAIAHNISKTADEIDAMIRLMHGLLNNEQPQS